jgi:hypothetical protein
MDHGGAQELVHELVHWASAVVLVVGGGVAIALAWLARRREDGRARARIRVPVAEPASLDRPLVVMLAGLSLGAAAIHLVAAPSHYVELGDLGAGFLAAAALQAAWAKSLLGGPSRRTFAVGFAINGAILGAWLLSRTIGLPAGPTPWLPEPVGLPDGAAAAFEGLLLAGIGLRWAVPDRRSAGPFSLARPLLAIAVVPVLGLVMLTTSLATLAIGAGAAHGAAAMPGHAEPAGIHASR